MNQLLKQPALFLCILIFHLQFGCEKSREKPIQTTLKVETKIEAPKLQLSDGWEEIGEVTQPKPTKALSTKCVYTDAAILNGTGRLEGVITIKETDEAVLNTYLVLADRNKRKRLYSDLSGHFSIENASPGLWRLGYECMTRSWLNSHYLEGMVSVGDGQDCAVQIEIPQARCLDEQFHSVDAVYTGFYKYGFEDSSFLPCDADKQGFALDKEDPYAWVEFQKNENTDLSLEPYAWYAVTLKGVLSGVGTYGHLDVSKYEMKVETILSAKQWKTEPNCSELTKSNAMGE